MGKSLPPIWQDLYRQNEIFYPTPHQTNIDESRDVEELISVNPRSNWWGASFCRVFLVSVAIAVLIIGLRYS